MRHPGRQAAAAAVVADLVRDQALPDRGAAWTSNSSSGIGTRQAPGAGDRPFPLDARRLSLPGGNVNGCVPSSNVFFASTSNSTFVPPTFCSRE